MSKTYSSNGSLGCVPRISLVIPTYDRARYIDRLLADLCPQAPADWEIIVIDDGSRDNTPAVLTKYAEYIDYRIEPNRGVSAARNLGLSLARGKYVKFVDSDDLCIVAGVEALYALAESGESAEIHLGIGLAINGQGERLPRCCHNPSDSWPEGVIDHVRAIEFGFATWMPLFPREPLVAVGGFVSAIRTGEDTELAWRLMASGYRFVFHRIILADVEEHDGPRVSVEPRVPRYYQARRVQHEHTTRSIRAINAPELYQAYAKLLWWYGREARANRCFPEARWFFWRASHMAGRVAIGETRLRYWLSLLMPPRLAVMGVRFLNRLIPTSK